MKKNNKRKVICKILSCALLFSTVCFAFACKSQNKPYKEQENFIDTSIGKLRDPCVLAENGVYYMYGTGWKCFKNTSGKLAGEWEDLGVVVQIPSEAIDNYWAPEVHKYNGKYYMFTTYMSSVTNLRGCTVMMADTPEGPFVEISNGQITAEQGYHAIDGTLYVDENGDPWMVYVREWIGAQDGVGSMMAARLSSDLTHFITKPIELFRANEPKWAKKSITDGCWLYKCENGELIMLWSNFNKYGYCVAIARSSNGKIDGEWTHDEQLLFSGEDRYFDGGHAMIFETFDGSKFLAMHSPNQVILDREEKPVFIKLKEENGKLYLIECPL